MDVNNTLIGRVSLMRIGTILRALAVLLALSGLVACGASPRGGDATPTVTAAPARTKVPTFTPLPAPSQTAPVAPAATPSPVSSPSATATTSLATPSGPATVAASGSLAYQPEFPAISPAVEPPAVAAGVNPLTGQPAANPALAQRRPILVRFGNDPAARPPTAISQAEVVLEDVMDAYWVTRLSAIFLEADPVEVGPIRSARPVNIELAPAFDAVFVYSGASTGTAQALAQQPMDRVYDGSGDQLFYRGGTHAAPHNLYTNLEKVRAWVKSKGWERLVSLRGWTFASAVPTSATPAERVDIPYPATSAVAWTWDAGAGVYRRWAQGVAYTDAATKQQVGCENVVILYARHWDTEIVEDSNGAKAIGIALRGGGRVQMLRDGRIVEGTWWRRDANWLPQFIDAQGQPIPLKPGHTWVQIVPLAYQVSVR